MDELLKRIKMSIEHLIAVDGFFKTHDENYKEISQKLHDLGISYNDLSKTLYEGVKGRQMILADIVEYILTGRGYWFATQSKANRGIFIKIIMNIVNLLLLQENVTHLPNLRREFMENLKQCNLEGFFEEPELEDEYSECLSFNDIVIPRGETRSYYTVVDSLLPKSLGTVFELIVYTDLIREGFGYVAPLLLYQRLMKKMKLIVPPDFLVLRKGQAFGVEVGGGGGRFSLSQDKIGQCNTFMEQTSIPVLTVNVPDVYRCPVCRKWILFCEEVIERYSNVSSKIESQIISCIDCNYFANGECKDVTYFGQIEKGGGRARYHYKCVKHLHYIQTVSLSKDENKRKKLISYFPNVEGLESLGK